MKVKRQKQVRRHVRFYRVIFGFHEPFKVLCDGNFIHHHLQSKYHGSIHDSLSKLLGGSVRALVTPCVLAELRKLGPDFKATCLEARSVSTAPCPHESGAVAAADCIRSMVGSRNAEHLFVATQDVELRRELRKVPGAALVLGSNYGLLLEPPSEVQQKYARMTEAERMHATERERAAAEAGAAAQVAGRVEEGKGGQGVEEDGGGGVTVGDDIDGDGSGARPGHQDSAANLGPRKQRRAKGPNPLSVKRKTKPLAGGGGRGRGGGDKPKEASEGPRHHRKRRKRHKAATPSGVPPG